MEAEKKVYYPEDLVRETGLSVSLIYRQLREDKIPHVRVGDRYIISQENYDKWINGQGGSN